MKKRVFKAIPSVIAMWMLLLTGAPQTSYAHDPSETPYPDKSHIHITGKVTTPDNKPIEGVLIKFPSQPFQGVPPGCLYGTLTLGKTNETGFYESRVLFNTADQKCRDAFDNATPYNKIEFKATKEGYDIKIK